MVEYFIWPGVGLEHLSIIFAVPVMVVNNFVWLEPEMGEKLYEKRIRE
jgi:hypothetical protein